MQVENYKKDDNNNGGVAGHEVEAIKAASLVSVELFHTEHVVQDRGFG